MRGKDWATSCSSLPHAFYTTMGHFERNACALVVPLEWMLAPFSVRTISLTSKMSQNIWTSNQIYLLISTCKYICTAGIRAQWKTVTREVNTVQSSPWKHCENTVSMGFWKSQVIQKSQVRSPRQVTFLSRVISKSAK